MHGELAEVGYTICDSTVANLLKQHGIEPSPVRKRTGSWATILKSHWSVLAAIDFTTVEVWTARGLRSLYRQAFKCQADRASKWLNTVLSATF